MSAIFRRLLSFVGREVNVVLESNGTYSVKGTAGTALVNSGRKREDESYCPDYKLKEHVGHKISVVTYGLGKPVNVAIECEDCCEVLFDVDLDND